MKEAMRAAVACFLSIALWVMGHTISKVMNNGVLYWLYPAYNRLMIWSANIEDWAGVEIMWGSVGPKKYDKEK